MKALMVMYDSLRRDLLSVYGGPIPAPNFERLAAHTVCFDKSYVGSLPCMALCCRASRMASSPPNAWMKL